MTRCHTVFPFQWPKDVANLLEVIFSTGLLHISFILKLRFGYHLKSFPILLATLPYLVCPQLSSSFFKPQWNISLTRYVLRERKRNYWCVCLCVWTQTCATSFSSFICCHLSSLCCVVSVILVVFNPSLSLCPASHFRSPL